MKYFLDWKLWLCTSLCEIAQKVQSNYVSNEMETAGVKNPFRRASPWWSPHDSPSRWRSTPSRWREIGPPSSVSSPETASGLVRTPERKEFNILETPFFLVHAHKGLYN